MKRNDSYLIRVSMGRDSQGAKIVKSITYHPSATTPKAIEKEVKRFADDYEQKVLHGDIYDGDHITFDSFVKVWEANWIAVQMKKGELTQTTYDNYLRHLRIHVLPYIGHMKINKIKALHIQRILNDMTMKGLAPKTVKYTFTSVNSVFTFAYKKDFIDQNPCARCDVPQTKRDQKLHYFTVEQAKRFLEAMKREYPVIHKAHKRTLTQTGEEYVVPDYVQKQTISTQFQAFFYLAIYGGFRRGELCALRWNDIDFKKQTVRIDEAFAKTTKGQMIKGPKTEAGNRTVKLPKICFDVLAEWRKEEIEIMFKLGTAWKGSKQMESFENSFVFIQTDSGEPMNLDTPYHKFKEICAFYNSTCEKEEDQLPNIRLHDLRHTSATLLISQNVDIETIAHRLGHSKASVTLDIYGHPLKEMDEKASDTLEALFG